MKISRLDLSFNADLSNPKEERKVTLDLLGYTYKNHFVEIRMNTSEKIGKYYSYTITEGSQIKGDYGKEMGFQELINEINDSIDHGLLDKLQKHFD